MPVTIIGYIALTLFFGIILASLMGVIPQSRLPIQSALIVATLVIVLLAFVGNFIGYTVELIYPIDLLGQIIIHPITALMAGFFVAGALEASGGFEAAADLLDRMAKTKLGLPGTACILANMPTIISMPCGRILGAALMPAALYFGWILAEKTGKKELIGVLVFSFIVNAAASCGPSPLGGIGMIGEGMIAIPLTSLQDPQQAGIMLATGTCALVMRFVTPLLPAE